MKRVSLAPLWYFIIACFVVTLNSGVQAQQTPTSVQTKEKTTVQQKPRLQVDTAKNKTGVKSVPGTEKDKVPTQKDAADVKGEGKEPTQYQHRVEKDQQGHAYGKDKGGLEGKEFGQERAEQAKMNRETKSKELNETIQEGEQKVKEARERIEVAKVQLEKDKQMGRISEQVFQERKERISKAEQAVSDLEYSLYMGKKAISR